MNCPKCEGEMKETKSLGNFTEYNCENRFCIVLTVTVKTTRRK